jgi:hypothetical protein
MSEWWFVIGVLFGAGLAWFLLQKEVRWLRYELVLQAKEIDAEEQLASGFQDFNQQLQQIKANRKLSIIDILQGTFPLPSSHFADHFEISNRTTLRYLNELEDEDRVERTSKTGRNTKWQISQANLEK